jgi:hypothetical protein
MGTAAAPAQFICVVNGPKATVPGGAVTIVLTDTGGTFFQKVFTADPGAKDEILAVALAAFQTRCQTSAMLSSPTVCSSLEILTGPPA